MWTSNPVPPATPVLPLHGSVTQCPAVERRGGDICSSPPAKSPHNMVLFMCIFFQYPHNVEKKRKFVWITTKEIQLQETYSPPKLPWAHSGMCCCMRTSRGEDDLVSTSVAKDSRSHHRIRCHALEQSCLHMQTICLWWNKGPVPWNLAWRWKRRHVWGNRSG